MRAGFRLASVTGAGGESDDGASGVIGNGRNALAVDQDLACAWAAHSEWEGGLDKERLHVMWAAHCQAQGVLGAGGVAPPTGEGPVGGGKALSITTLLLR